MDPDKLAKVLAMAESEHQGEAQSALRAARIMLSRAGLSFRDLARGARPVSTTPEPPPAASAPPPDRPPPPDQLVQGLRRQVRDLELEVAGLKRQLEKSNGDMERQREEADRWRGLARETAEKLWDLGTAATPAWTSAGPSSTCCRTPTAPCWPTTRSRGGLAPRPSWSPIGAADWPSSGGRSACCPGGRAAAACGAAGVRPARPAAARPWRTSASGMGYPVAVTISDRSGPLGKRP
ncbi:DUF2786 domain-containing protein [Azospirillum brasilense]|uniref:DUF2786 domain-containing protein n=1 Tax=Azospirillum brasilense TaxID=192 RepID=UPI0003A0D8E7|nr:DUF2786 domain-containing protein [Azospirillum brasilense]